MARRINDYVIRRDAFFGGPLFVIYDEHGSAVDYNGHAGWDADGARYATVKEAREALERIVYGNPATMTATAEGDRAMAEAEADIMEAGYF